MAELQHCPECGSTMARIFKPKPGHRCIVCWKFYPDNPDIAIPLAIGIGSGIAGGTAYALTSKALEQNPQIKMSPKQHLEMLYNKISAKFPSLDKHDFQYAYNIAIASMANRDEKKLKYVMRGMTPEEKEDIHVVEFKTDHPPKDGFHVDESHYWGIADKPQGVKSVLKTFDNYVPYKFIIEFTEEEYEEPILLFRAVKSNTFTTIGRDIYNAEIKPFFLTAEPEVSGMPDTNDGPLVFRHPVRGYYLLLAPRIVTETNDNLEELKKRYGIKSSKKGPKAKKIIYEQIYDKLLKVVPLEVIKQSDRGSGSKSKAPGIMDLNYDYLYYNKEDKSHVIALSHYYKHISGDMIADPDMEIKVIPSMKMAEALTYQDIHGYQKVYPEMGKVDVKAKKDLNTFLSQWLTNLKNQGHKIGGPQEQQVEAKGIYRIMKRNVIVRKGNTNYNFPYKHGIVKPPKYMSAADVREKLGFEVGLESGFDTFIEEIEKAGYKRAQGTNPESTHELYETFHGVPVDKTFKAKIPDPVGELEYVAKIDHLVYICQGKKAVGDDDGEDISYIHRWKKAKMLLVRDEDKNYFIAGKCRVIKSGINDFKGRATWSKNDFKVKVPKKVVYVGLLPEIKAGGKVYRFTDTILCTDAKGERLFITELTRGQPTHPGN